MSTTRRRRLALIVLVVFAAGGCLALGWWQWTRFQSASGTFQNLGYALQWPAFAGFCVYAYRKFVRYEEAPPENRNTHTVNEIPDGLLPDRPKATQQNSDDPALREYNAYLAELAKADNDNHPKQNRLIALCYELVVHYIVKVSNPPTWIGIVHGWVYFAYVLAAFNLAVKVRWPILKTIGVLLAGTIPLLGIIVEHFQTRNVKAQFNL
jgi:integral membrane protein